MADKKITKVWFIQVLAMARAIAEKFGLTSVAENLQQTENELSAVPVVIARASDFASFNEAMGAFAADTYLSQTRNNEYQEEAKKIKYTIFSGKVGDKFSSPLKQSIDAAVESWSNIKCVYSYTCPQGKCPNDKYVASGEVLCSYDTCKQGMVNCSNGLCPNEKIIFVCRPDNVASCKTNVVTKTESCSNGPCQQGWVRCDSNQTLPEVTCSKKRTVYSTVSCEHEICSQGTLYDIRCDKTTEVENENDRT